MNGLTEMHADFFSEFKGNRCVLLDTIEASYQLQLSAIRRSSLMSASSQSKCQPYDKMLGRSETQSLIRLVTKMRLFLSFSSQDGKKRQN